MRLYNPSRRDLLRLTAMAPAVALGAASPVRAALGAPTGGQAPGWFRFSLGDLRVTIVSDGNMLTPVNAMAVNAPDNDVIAFLQAHRLSTEINYAHTNHVIVENGTDTVLIDVGSGSRFQPSTGRLMDNLAKAGIDADAITHIALTHAHPDHVWGLRDDFDELVLPDASYFIGQSEFENWNAPGLADRLEGTLQQFAVGAVNSLAVAEPNLTLVNDGHQIIDGVTMINTPGHTAGHMGLLIESGAERMLVLGDSAAHAYISFERPDWVQGIDEDDAMTIATRRRLFDWAAADGIAVAGYHFPFPGVGHVMKDGDAYRFLPALWNWG